MTIAEKYPLDAPQPIYDFIDFATGQAYVILYGLRQGSTYTLTKTQIPSSHIIDGGTGPANDSTGQPVEDIDFDMQLEKAIIVEGKLRVSVPLTCSAPSTGQGECYIIARVRHWDGTTETELATGTSTTINRERSGGADTNLDGELNAVTEVDVPRTNFPAGDTFRLTIHIRAWGIGGPRYIFAHDPMNRTPNQMNITSSSLLVGAANTAGTDDFVMRVHLPIEVDS